MYQRELRKGSCCPWKMEAEEQMTKMKNEEKDVEESAQMQIDVEERGADESRWLPPKIASITLHLTQKAGGHQAPLPRAVDAQNN